MYLVAKGGANVWMGARAPIPLETPLLSSTFEIQLSACFSGGRVTRSVHVRVNSHAEKLITWHSKLATQVMRLSPSLTGLVLCALINPITTLWPSVENQLRGKLAPSHCNGCRYLSHTNSRRWRILQFFNCFSSEKFYFVVKLCSAFIHIYVFSNEKGAQNWTWKP